jgi:hypothetical protein
MKYFRNIAFLFVSMLLFAACSDDDATNEPLVQGDPTFTSSNVKDGAVYYSFDDERSAPQWDIKFGSYPAQNSPSLVPMFLLNETLLGNTHVRIYNTEATMLDDVTTPDAARLSMDEAMEVQGDTWFSYNFQTHTVASRQFVYVVETSAGVMVKFRIDAYDQAQDVFTISHARYDAATSTWGAAQQLTVDITDAEQLVSFDNGIVEPMRWDIKLTVIAVPTPIGPMNFPGIVLNRAAGVTAAVVDGMPFADVIPASTTGLAADTETAFVIGTECLDYDENSHRLSPFVDRSFVLQTVGGKRVKFEMLSYYNDELQSGYMKFAYVLP